MNDIYALKVHTGSGAEHVLQFGSEEDRVYFVNDMVGTVNIIRSAEAKDIHAE
jgi:hypothetical protein